MLYEGTATVLVVHDGDTIHLRIAREFCFPIDPWFGMAASIGYTWTHDVKCRLARCNAPEIATPEGIASRDALIALLSNVHLRVTACELDKYGRPLVEIYAGHGTVSVSDRMIALGMAKAWDGHGPKP